jgi:hypothetical protein
LGCCATEKREFHEVDATISERGVDCKNLGDSMLLFMLFVVGHSVIAKPALLYGSECWTLRQKYRNRINSSQMEFIRPLTGVTLRERIKGEGL